MLNSIRKLYQKFVVENPDINISHILAFCDANHFGLPVLEILTERHAFASNMTTFNTKTANLQEIIELYTCDTENIVCMYGCCQKCVDIRVQLEGMERTEAVSWFKWQNIKEKE